jgi:2-keto-4-pentenoate hydratase/2-oxohepta-3-ene-1,7-dioic acid hydratase in catechol pathway
MIFSCKFAVSYLSQGTTLEKGTLIQMGTPSGIGWARTPKRIIKDGEEMKIFFGGGIGTLVNTFKYQ